MKEFIIPLFSLFLLSCSPSPPSLAGHWLVEDSFHAAQYELFETEAGLSAKVLSYVDGTSRYAFSEQNPRYHFRDLTFDGQHFVDEQTTEIAKCPFHKNKTAKTISLRLCAADTLEVSTYMHGHTLTEFWIKK